MGVLIGAVSTVWFTIGGTRDMLRMFKALGVKKTSMLDDGRVVDGVSADDVAMVEKVDHINIEKAHVEEKILEEKLKKEGDLEDLKNLREHEKKDNQDKNE